MLNRAPLSRGRKSLTASAICSLTFLLCTNASAADAQCSDTERHELVLDAGSSKTRAYLYSVKKLPTGKCHVERSGLKLSDDAKKTKYPLIEGAGTLDDMLRHLSEELPKNDIDPGHVRVNIAATAGMRKASAAQATEIYTEADAIVAKYRFLKGEARTISGAEEGAYAWVDSNRAKIEHGAHDTNAIFEIGGSSIQIAFEDGDLKQNTSLIRLKIDNTEYLLFSHSVIGLGADDTREAIGGKTLASMQEMMRCYPKGFEITYGKDKEALPGAYDYDRCNALYTSILNAAADSREATSLQPLLQVREKIAARSFLGLSVLEKNQTFLKKQTGKRDDELKDIRGVDTALKQACNQDLETMKQKDPSDASYVHTSCANTTLSTALIKKLAIDPTRMRFPTRSPEWADGYLFMKYRGEILPEPQQ